MKRNARLIRLAINGSETEHENVGLSDAERDSSSTPASRVELLRESPLTIEQVKVAVEMENMGFDGSEYFNDNEKDMPLYTNNSPLSVFTTTNQSDPQDPNVFSVENNPHLTPLFTPIPSVEPLANTIHNIVNSNTPSPASAPTSPQQSFVEDSDDSVADPNYEPSDNAQTPIDTSSLIPMDSSHSSNNSLEIGAPSSVDTNVSSQEENISPRTNRNKRKTPDDWKKNIRKEKRNTGEGYLIVKGIEKPAKECSTENCNCHRACHTKIDTSARQALFDTFWGLQDLQRQRDFIATNVLSTDAKSRVQNSKRKFTLSYGFKVNSERIDVCQTYFLGTLGVSERMVRTSVEKARRGVGGIQSPDKRGRHEPPNKYDDETIAFANSHIDMFPAVPSHWCRKDTKKTYLESVLNKEKMYDLYTQHCSENEKVPVGKTLYKELILKKNIDFHRPRKDQCWCHKFDQLRPDDQNKKQEELEEHVNRKDCAQEEKKSDKIMASTDSKIHMCTFDFEAVLYCPLVLGKPVFYKRKLGSMNFTIHNAVTKQGYCYFWPEYEGNRGSNEVATCLYDYINKLTDVDHLILYSDCCPGQNRNSVLATMLHSIIMSPENSIEVIDYKFLEPGHTYMECDSMHSAIERASEYSKIYLPEDWQNVIRLARKEHPYEIKSMSHNDFLDFKTLRKHIMWPVVIKASDGSALQWGNIRWLQFKKSSPGVLFFKMDYWEDFKEAPVSNRMTRAGYSRAMLTTLYDKEIVLPQIKHKDLLSMCQDGTIPRPYHTFYETLPVASSNPTPGTSTGRDDDLALSATRSSYLRRRRNT